MLFIKIQIYTKYPWVMKISMMYHILSINDSVCYLLKKIRIKVWTSEILSREVQKFQKPTANAACPTMSI